MDRLSNLFTQPVQSIQRVLEFAVGFTLTQVALASLQETQNQPSSKDTGTIAMFLTAGLGVITAIACCCLWARSQRQRQDHTAATISVATPSASVPSHIFKASQVLLEKDEIPLDAPQLSGSSTLREVMIAAAASMKCDIKDIIFTLQGPGRGGLTILKPSERCIQEVVVSETDRIMTYRIPVVATSKAPRWTPTHNLFAPNSSSQPTARWVPTTVGPESSSSVAMPLAVFDAPQANVWWYRFQDVSGKFLEPKGVDSASAFLYVIQAIANSMGCSPDDITIVHNEMEIWPENEPRTREESNKVLFSDHPVQVLRKRS